MGRFDRGEKLVVPPGNALTDIGDWTSVAFPSFENKKRVQKEKKYETVAIGSAYHAK